MSNTTINCPTPIERKDRKMTEEKKQFLLRGLDKYYANRQDLSDESDDSQIIEINGLKVRKISGTIAEYARKHNLVSVESIQWTK